MRELELSPPLGGRILLDANPDPDRLASQVGEEQYEVHFASNK